MHHATPQTRIERPQRHFHVAPWELTFTAGVVKMAIATTAIAIAIFRSDPIPSLAGWMMLGGGLAELLISSRGGTSWIGRLTLGSGAVTAIAGLLFISLGWTGLFPLTQYVMIWLLLRGGIALWVARLSQKSPAANWGWLILRGGVDLSLSLMLLIGGPFAMLVHFVFGETRQVSALFLLVVATSFAAAGVGLMAIAIAQWRQHLATPFLTDAKD